jgi:hypothetical protein
MDIKQLLEKMDQFAGQAVGQKPGDQWRGDDPNPPGKKLVGSSESVLKDLSKGKSPKTKEQELAEEWATFSEENIGTHPKRAGRKSDRHARGHEPKPRYKTIKTENWPKMIEFTPDLVKALKAKGYNGPYKLNTLKKLNKELNGYEGIDGNDLIMARDNNTWVISVGSKFLVGAEGNVAPATAKQILGREIAEAGSPAQQAAIAIAMKKAGKKPKNEGAEQDPIVAKVVKQMRPGLTGLNMGNEAFLYFAYELGKQRARDAWEDYLPAIRAEYEKGLNEDANTDNKLAKLLTRFINQSEGADRAVAADAIEYIRKLGHIEQFATSLDYFVVDLDEGVEEDGPVEARWMVKVSDDEGDHLKTYHRKFPSLSDAKKAYKNTPYATDFKYKPVKQDKVEEAVVGQDTFNRAGYNPISDESDYLKKLSNLSNLSRKPGLDQQMKDQIKQRILDLNAEARKKGYIQAESRGHTIIANKLKDVERAKKFASGELKIPTPQERQAQLAKQKDKKEKVDEYGADNPAQATTQKASPAQVQQVAANLNTQKTALGQLKQLNPDINPQKAAAAATKDLATMSPQEKEELAQVAKTLTPALGSPAFGSIKTALQKIKNN